ncbi:MAG: FAD-binding and (Fe-S)-binding domain-containing protein [Candidatus Acidiferrales bacterium]
MTASDVRIETPTNREAKKTAIPSRIDVSTLEQTLRRTVDGEVRFDAGSRGLYAVDASNYRQVPIGVVIPKSIEDVIATVRAARENSAPILSRGGGTSLAGQCCNTAVVMDFSKYLNKVLDVDRIHRTARVQPGCVLDHLRDEAGKWGLTFGPDPATHDHCTLGGMLGNNSCGMHAQMSGAVASNVESMEILLYDGTRMTVGWMTRDEWEEKIRRGGREGEILSQLKELIGRYAEQIRSRYPNIPRRISGYNLDQLLFSKENPRVNLARALVGSESTLVTILEATLDLIHNPPFQSLVVLGYPDVYKAGDHVPEILKFKPMGFEGFDYKLIENMKKKDLHTKYLSRLPEGKGWLLVQFPGETKQEADDNARALIDHLKRTPNPPSIKLYDDPPDEKAIWEVRESALGATASAPGEPSAWPGWEDAAVPPHAVGDYLRDFCKLVKKYDYEAALYGHFGMGCIHCRITFDLQSERGIKHYRSFVEHAAELVSNYGGSLSGEHGDGQSRAELLPIMFGKKLVGAFREYKQIWDPDWKMNPGKVVDPFPLDSNLRLGANYNPAEPTTHFKFPDDDGSFAKATLRCVGVGKCRRSSSDDPENQTMCPSFMVTHEEKDTTRGRAHLLWEMLHGDVIKNGWRDEHVKDALDLCLACKGCKGDCPVNVDIPTYKAEFLSHYYKGRIRPRYAYAFGLIDKWAEVASIWPGLVNLAASTPGVREFVKSAAGISTRRSIPEFAPQTFQSWFSKQRPSGSRRRTVGKVVLFPDTFNNHFFPRTAKAAVDVLQDAGYEVEVPLGHVCCGRPLYDYGFLDLAKDYLRKMFDVLTPYAAAGTPIVVLEPSCWSVFQDEMRNMFPNRKETELIKKNTFLLSQFLVEKAHYHPPRLNRSAIVHGHCHHKAIIHGVEHEKKLLDEMQIKVRVLADACCGMAGSFGFEEHHFDVSAKVGEHGMLPAIRKAGLDEVIIADGFSCREQISQMSDRHGLHMAEVLQLAIQPEQAGADEHPPEKIIVERHKREIQNSKMQTLAVLGGISAIVAGAIAAAKSGNGKRPASKAPRHPSIGQSTQPNRRVDAAEGGQ